MIDTDETQLRLRRITSLTAVAIALIITLLFPSMYYVVASQYETKQLRVWAEQGADAISQLIYLTPQFWHLQEPRMADYLSTIHRQDSRLKLSVTTIEDEEIISVGHSIKWPSRSIRVSLSDGAKTVGWVNVEISTRSLLINLLIVGIASLALGVLVNIVLRNLPFAALERAMKSLAQSRSVLKSEVEAKDKALAELRELSNKVEHQSLHDELTDLPNRTYFQKHLHHLVDIAGREKRKLGVLLIDLDRFKEINDTLGHHMGDEVLIQTGHRIAKALPQSAFLARLGGDEYAVVLPGSAIDRSTRTAEEITASLQHHIIIDEYHLAAPGSIGITQYPEHGSTPSQLLRNADIAMYQAKRAGQPYRWYKHEVDTNAPDQLILTAELRHAIDNKQVCLHYQPKVSLQTEQVVGAEALARWDHPEYGFISPTIFVAIAEQAGMINALTELVMDLSIKQICEWRKLGTNLDVSINISAKNLQNENFPALVKQLADRWGAQPHWITFEITESSIMFDPDQAKTIIHNLRNWGASFALDDFGTGYSSLAYVKRLSVQELKIDRSFVINMIQDKDDQAIVRSTIDLAHSLGLSATAEGIEDNNTLKMLRDFKCDYAQGYYICEPLSPEGFVKWVAEQRSKNRFTLVN